MSSTSLSWWAAPPVNLSH